MKGIQLLIVCFIVNSYGQDSLLNNIPTRFSENYALINVIGLKYHLGLTDIALDQLPAKTFALIPLKPVYKKEKRDLKRMIRHKTPTNDPDWPKKQTIMLDTLSDIVKRRKTIRLDSFNHLQVYYLLRYHDISYFFKRKKLILICSNENKNFQKIKYRTRKIGDRRHVKILKKKEGFYRYYIGNGSTANIYSGSCFHPGATRLGRIIMFFQRIGW